MLLLVVPHGKLLQGCLAGPEDGRLLAVFPQRYQKAMAAWDPCVKPLKIRIFKSRLYRGSNRSDHRGGVQARLLEPASQPHLIGLLRTRSINSTIVCYGSEVFEILFEGSKAYLRRKGLPISDRYDLPTSEMRFPDGAHYRIEVPTCNSAVTFRAIMETAEEHGVTVNRVDETFGIMRHTEESILEYIAIAREHGCEVNFSIGPRATYDTSAQRATGTPEGNRIAYRIRGMDQVVRVMEDAKRAVKLGIRGLLVYDEGCLWLLNEMRNDGEIPKDVRFKLSAHCGHGNPLSFRLLEQLGADSINPVRDLTLPMISCLRQAVKVALDIHTDNPKSTGGFIRTYEAPEIVRIAAPVHLKAGNSALTSHGIPTSHHEGVNMGIQAVLVARMVERYYPGAKQSERGAQGLAIPE